jgi:hypothetical protein
MVAFSTVIRVLATREKEGEGSRFDRLRWERELVELRSELALIQAQAAQARSRCLSFFRKVQKSPKLRALAFQLKGSEIQAPMAMVILSGLFTSTLLNMIVIPSVLGRVGRQKDAVTARPAAPGQGGVLGANNSIYSSQTAGADFLQPPRGEIAMGRGVPC